MIFYVLLDMQILKKISYLTAKLYEINLIYISIENKISLNILQRDERKRNVINIKIAIKTHIYFIIFRDLKRF